MGRLGLTLAAGLVLAASVFGGCARGDLAAYKDRPALWEHQERWSP